MLSRNRSGIRFGSLRLGWPARGAPKPSPIEKGDVLYKAVKEVGFFALKLVSNRARDIAWITNFGIFLQAIANSAALNAILTGPPLQPTSVEVRI